MNSYVVILQEFAEVLNNAKKLSTGFCKEEEFQVSKGGVELTSSVFGLSRALCYLRCVHNKALRS